MRARVVPGIAALLLLLAGASAASTHFVYESAVQVGPERVVSSASVMLVPHGDGVFRLRLANVVIGGRPATDGRFEAHDALVHLRDGLVTGIQFESGDDVAAVTNFKRSVAEALQAPRVAIHAAAAEMTAAGERIVSSARSLADGRGVTVTSASETPLALVGREQRRRIAYFADGESLPEHVETTTVIAVGAQVKSTITTRIERAAAILVVDAPLRALGDLFPAEPLTHVGDSAPDAAEVTAALLDVRSDRRALGALAARLCAMPAADADVLVRAAADALDTVADEDGAVLRRLVSLLTRVASPAAQAELARLVGGASPSAVVDALFALPADVTVEPSLIAAAERLAARSPAGSALADKAQLLVGALARRAAPAIARGVLAPLVERLDSPVVPVRERVHLLSVLANAGAAVPAQVLAAHLDSDDAVIRAAAERAVAARARIASVAAAAASPSAELLAALIARLVDVQSSTAVWNDSSDPLYDLVAPLAERDADVLRYPSHSAYLTSSTFGGDRVGFRFAAGTFSGSGSSLCLAGNFKALAKAYFDWNLRGDQSDILDAALYAYTFGNEFEARAYVEVFGALILDINLGVNCTDEHLDIFDATFDILDEYYEYPFDAGTATIAIRLAVGVGLAADYQLCLLTLNPFLDAALRVDMDVEAELGVDLQIKNALRGGVTGAAYFQYSIGPQTYLGGRNSTSGELLCEACIGVYASNEAGYADVVGWYQRREGFGWGDPVEKVFADYQLPANPWLPLVETCASA